MHNREKFLTVLLTLAKVADELKLPYRFGGGHLNSPVFTEGIDCSGLVRIPMIWIGFRLQSWECTSRTLFKEFSGDPNLLPVDVRDGMLAFWKNDDGQIRHVEICVRVLGIRAPDCIGARESLNRSAHWADVLQPRRSLIWAGAADPFA